MSGRRVALVTGAAHGQGSATSLALAREGYDIVALDVAAPLAYPGYAMGTSGELESLRGECEELGAACLSAVADVRDDAAVSAAVDAAVERFRRIDVLFNNAGICAYGLAHELTEEAWDTMLDINLKGRWIVARRVIPHMIAARRGVIVNNSSVAGLRGMGRLSHYSASKWGLTGLTKSWAIELAPYASGWWRSTPPASTRHSQRQSALHDRIEPRPRRRPAHPLTRCPPTTLRYTPSPHGPFV